MALHLFLSQFLAAQREPNPDLPINPEHARRRTISRSFNGCSLDGATKPLTYNAMHGMTGESGNKATMKPNFKGFKTRRAWLDWDAWHTFRCRQDDVEPFLALTFTGVHLIRKKNMVEVQ